MVGPTGNSSDTNPVFWALRGFQPPDQQTSGEEYLNVNQKWVNFRSSDFVVSDQSLKGSIFGQYDYYASDETGDYQQTNVYWDTKVTNVQGSKFNVDATYSAAPPDGTPVTPFNGEQSFPKSSQYVTLSDVCSYGFDSFLRHNIPPQSKLPPNNTHFYTTTISVFPSFGATARIENIGADTAKLTITGSTNSDFAYGNANMAPDCEENIQYVTYFADSFVLYQEEDAPTETDNFWNTCVTVSLSFEGNIVKENSTSINGTKSGVPQFAAGYVRAPAQSAVSATSGAHPGAALLPATMTAMVLALAFLSILVI